jgi:hypothetical protein
MREIMLFVEDFVHQQIIGALCSGLDETVNRRDKRCKHRSKPWRHRIC